MHTVLKRKGFCFHLNMCKAVTISCHKVAVIKWTEILLAHLDFNTSPVNIATPKPFLARISRQVAFLLPWLLEKKGEVGGREACFSK